MTTPATRTVVPVVHYATAFRNGQTARDSGRVSACGLFIRLLANGMPRQGQPLYLGGGREALVDCPACRAVMLVEGDLTRAEYEAGPKPVPADLGRRSADTDA